MTKSMKKMTWLDRTRKLIRAGDLIDLTVYLSTSVYPTLIAKCKNRPGLFIET